MSYTLIPKRIETYCLTEKYLDGCTLFDETLLLHVGKVEGSRTKKKYLITIEIESITYVYFSPLTMFSDEFDDTIAETTGFGYILYLAYKPATHSKRKKSEKLWVPKKLRIRLERCLEKYTAEQTAT